MRPLTALFFSPSLGAGGAEMQMLRLLKHLDRSAVLPSLSVARPGGSYESWLPNDVEVHACTHGIRSSLGSVAASVVPLRRRIEELRPDVVVSLLEHSSLALTSALAFLERPPRVVLGIQNNFSRSIESAPRWLGQVLRPLYLRAYARADHVVALSHGVASDLARLLPQVAGRTSVVYNAGVDEQVQRLSREGLERERPERPIVLACGRLNTQKDYPTLLRAFAQLRASAPPELWVLGDGPHRKALGELADELGVADRVRWLGFQKNPYAFMAAADVFALSSRWEGFANVVVEALACGTPVVSTDCPYGPGEILDGGKHGRLVPVGDAPALAEAIGRALTEGKSEVLRHRCRERARHFSAESSAAGYEDVLARVVGEPRSAAGCLTPTG